MEGTEVRRVEGAFKAAPALGGASPQLQGPSQ